MTVAIEVFFAAVAFANRRLDLCRTLPNPGLSSRCTCWKGSRKRHFQLCIDILDILHCWQLSVSLTNGLGCPLGSLPCRLEAGGLDEEAQIPQTKGAQNCEEPSSIPF